MWLALVAVLSAMSALMIFAVYELELPFQRGERVTGSVFHRVVDDGTAS
jgi:hypothetical protein